jgi:hypothetical protein
MYRSLSLFNYGCWRPRRAARSGQTESRTPLLRHVLQRCAMIRGTAVALTMSLLYSHVVSVPSLPAQRVLVVDGAAGREGSAVGTTHPDPFRSVGEAACRAVEQERQLMAADGAPAQRWTLELRGGTYPSLSEHDLRCFGVGVPLTIAPHAGEPVVMTAGVRIPSSAFKPASGGSSPSQLSASLPGIAASLAVGTYGVVSDCSSRIDVSMNGKPLTLARWPNINASTGYNEWGSVLSVLSQEPNAAFTLATATSSSCSNAVTTAQLASWAKEADLWTHGYWGFDWADSYAKVGTVYPDNATIRLSGNNQARKRHFLSTFYIKMIFLPRQARDKHRENSKKCRFLAGKPRNRRGPAGVPQCAQARCRQPVEVQGRGHGRVKVSDQAEGACDDSERPLRAGRGWGVLYRPQHRAVNADTAVWQADAEGQR